MKQIIAAAITAVFMTSAPAFANHGHIIQVHHGADYVTFALYEDAINICGVNNIFNSVITGGSVNPACMAQLPWYGITVAGRTTIPQLATFIGQTNAIDLVFSEFRANWNLLNSDAIIEGYSTATTQYAELEELLLGDNNSALGFNTNGSLTCRDVDAADATRTVTGAGDLNTPPGSTQ